MTTTTPPAVPFQRNPAKVAFQQFVAGGGAGLIEILIMQPLDVVKTRFQIQVKGSAGAYNGLGDCFRTIYRTEGGRAFYKGIVPPICAETPKRATKFFAFERYAVGLTPIIGKEGGKDGQKVRTPLVYSLAGFLCGATEAVVVNPFERVKIQLQAERGVSTNPWLKCKEIYAKGGWNTTDGLNRGLTSTIGRHAVWNCIYFGLYHTCKDVIPDRKEAGEMKYFGMRVFLGLCAGTLASIVNIPYDVAKSRIQGPLVLLPNGKEKYTGCHQTMMLVAKEEGPKALFKGLAPKLMRLGPSGAIMMLVYETLTEKMAIWWP